MPKTLECSTMEPARRRIQPKRLQSSQEKRAPEPNDRVRGKMQDCPMLQSKTREAQLFRFLQAEISPVSSASSVPLHDPVFWTFRLRARQLPSHVPAPHQLPLAKANPHAAT